MEATSILTQGAVVGKFDAMDCINYALATVFVGLAIGRPGCPGR